MAAGHKLISLNLKWANHEQVEMLHQAVRTSQTTLMAVKAEGALFAEKTTRGLLVNNLPPGSQERWDHAPGSSEDLSPHERGAEFLHWLGVEGAAAVRARRRQLAEDLQRETKPTRIEVIRSGGGKQGIPKKNGAKTPWKHSRWSVFSLNLPRRCRLRRAVQRTIFGASEDK